MRKAARESAMENPIHLMRWLKAQAVGGSEEAAARAVAKSEGKSIDVVKHSIQMVSAYRARNDKSNFDFVMRDLLTANAPQAKDTLNGLLSAMELVEVPDGKTGKKKVVQMEDKTTRLEALRVYKGILDSLQPKAALINQDISQTNQTANISSGGAGAAETTEERLRRLRKAAAEHRLLPPEVIGVPQHIDEEADDDDEEDDGEEVDE